MTTQPEALRLARKFEEIGFVGDHKFAQDHWCRQAAVELRRLHAENAALHSGYDAALHEIDALKTRVQELGEMARENRSKRIVELEGRIAEMESEAADNARILGASAEKELALRARVEELERELAAIGAGGVEPLRSPKASVKHSDAIVFANDRPDSGSDWLMEWAIDAEDLIRSQHAMIVELNDQLAAIGAGGVEPLRKRAAVKESLTPASTVNQQLTVPTFSPTVQRKLDDLLTQGFRITGYAIERADIADWAPQRGFVTHGGLVGWWTQHADLQEALARLIAATELHHRNPLDLENLGRYNEAKRRAKQAIGMDDA